MALTELQVETLVEKYLRERDRFDKMASVIARRLSAELRASAIPHVLTFRAKDPESLRGKLARDQEHDFISFEREFGPGVKDLAGVRVMLYQPVDREATCDAIEDLFEVRFHHDHLETDGYQAWHRCVALPGKDIASDPAYQNLDGVLCEVQVVVLSDHIWNELQHDILYKTPEGAPSDVQKALLGSLRGQLNAVRTTVDQLIEATRRQREGNLAPIETPEELSEALELRAGRRLHGDFAQLLRLLGGVLTNLTRAGLHRLPLDGAALDMAAELLNAAGIEGRDDVALVVGALWPNYGDDFLQLIGSWRGRPGSIVRLLQKLGQAREEGKIE